MCTVSRLVAHAMKEAIGEGNFPSPLMGSDTAVKRRAVRRLLEAAASIDPSIVLPADSAEWAI